MAEAIDWEASQAAGRTVVAKDTGPRDKRALRSAAAWERVAEELRNETGIPSISYAYFDTKNEFVVRLRGTPDRVIKDQFTGQARILTNGIYPNLHKDFTFKGEGKSGYLTGTEMEKWVREIIKWARSLDGKREMEIADGKEAAPKAV